MFGVGQQIGVTDHHHARIGFFVLRLVLKPIAATHLTPNPLPVDPRIRRGPCLFVPGRWSLVPGPGPVAHGLWSMVLGNWSVAEVVRTEVVSPEVVRSEVVRPEAVRP